MFTDVGFHLKSGFKKLLYSQMLVFTLILDSGKYCVHQFFLYLIVYDAETFLENFFVSFNPQALFRPLINCMWYYLILE